MRKVNNPSACRWNPKLSELLLEQGLIGADPGLSEITIAFSSEKVESVVADYKCENGVFKIEVSPGVAVPEF
jgi:hypothetical protein